jgi:D-alanine-D-alanine ligase
VIFGGQSAEHEVSCVTATHVLAAIDASRFDVTAVGITKSGRWVQDRDAFELAQAGALGQLRAAGEATSLPDLLDSPTAADSRTPAPSDPVVFLPLLHGPLGEDGTLQGMLELAGVPYVGCGVLASALAMDKAMAKNVLASAGIPQARWISLHADTWDSVEHAAGDAAAALGFPCFVKPANMGSSVGVTKAHDPAELVDALATAATYDEWIVVEETIDGREIEVAVLGNLNPKASLPGEIVPGAEFYDYDDKYADGAAQLLIPAPLSADETAAAQDLALRTYAALRCEGMARVDLFLDPARGFLVNEANTIPGFTPISMYPKMWEASGLAYRDLISTLVELAQERHRRKRRRTDH